MTRGAVTIDGATAGEIGAGLVVLLGVMEDDTEKDAAQLADKVAKLRIFPSAERPIDRDVIDAGGAVLVISQFTLCADTKKGNRPSFIRAARPETGAPLYDRFCARLRELGLEVATGRFGAMMNVEIHNDGPVTIALGW